MVKATALGSVRARRRRPALLGAVSTLVTLVVSLWVQVGLFFTQPGGSLADFRNYYPLDQLSYLAIVVNSANGDLRPVEPFTQTGVNHYPRAYYQFLGLLADVTNTPPAMAWNVMAAVAQGALVVMIAVSSILITRRWWTGFLGVIPTVLGTGAWLFSGDWKTELDSHAVLWGAFAVLFTANGESIGLCVAGIALLALLLVAERRVARRWRLVVAIAACSAIGVLAAVQTYSFLTATFLLVYVAAAYGLRARAQGRMWYLPASAVLVLAVFLLGPSVADRAGPLVALVFGAVPALPGLVALCREVGWGPVWAALALVAFAAPQSVGTLLGIAAEDPFLVYREASSSDLGVPFWDGVRSGAVLLAVLALVTAVGLWRRESTLVAVPLGAVVAWGLGASNDVWGANQEPYRFWINLFMLVGVLSWPLFLKSVIALTTSTRSEPVRPDGAQARRARPASIVAVGTVVLLLVIAIADYPRFRQHVSESEPFDFSTEQTAALVGVASASEGVGGVVLTDPCTDPYTLKIAWGGQTGFYNLGLAWPEHETAYRETLEARLEDWQLDLPAAQDAEIEWFLTDDACPAGWSDGLQKAGAEQIRSGSHPEGTYRLWYLPTT